MAHLWEGELLKAWLCVCLSGGQMWVAHSYCKCSGDRWSINSQIHVNIWRAVCISQLWLFYQSTWKCRSMRLLAWCVVFPPAYWLGDTTNFDWCLWLSGPLSLKPHKIYHCAPEMKRIFISRDNSSLKFYNKILHKKKKLGAACLHSKYPLQFLWNFGMMRWSIDIDPVFWQPV